MTTFDLDHALRLLHWLHPSGGLVEVRLLSAPPAPRRAWCGLFDDPTRLVEAVAKAAPMAGGVYVTLNVLRAPPQGRLKNQLQIAKKGMGASTEDVLRRDNLVIDLDPCRPKDVMSTEEEHAAAVARGEQVCGWLKSQGFPRPLVVHSGSGVHLHYPVELPTDDGGLVGRFLRALSERFDDERVHVDVKLSDAIRIIRLAGTMNRKGFATSERPHRMALVSDEPAERVVVPRALLESIAGSGSALRSTATAPVDEDTSAHDSPTVTPGDVERLLSAAGVGHSPARPAGRGRVWVLDACPFGEPHTDGGRVLLSDDGHPAAFCHHASCVGRGWTLFLRLASARTGSFTENCMDGDTSPPSLPLFPESAFRGEAARYRDLVAPTTEAPESFHFASFAAIIGALIGRKLRLPWGAEWLYPFLHVAIVGQTAKAKKSTAIETARAVLIDSVLRDGGRLPAPSGLVVINGGGTGEGIADQFADSAATKDAEAVTGRNGVVLVNELGAWMDKIRRDQAGSLMELILESFDARPKFESRLRSKDSPSLVLTGTAIVIHAASTVEWLAQSLRPQDIEVGMVNRFLFITGQSNVLMPFRSAVDHRAATGLVGPIRRMLEVARGDFSFTVGACAAHAERYRAFRLTEEDELVAKAIARSDVQALRLAMLLAAFEHRVVGTERDIEAAWEIVRHSQETARGILGRMSVSLRQQLENRVEAAVRRLSGGTPRPVRKRDLQQRLKGGQRQVSAEDISRAIRALVSVGVLVEVGDTVWLAAPGGGPRRSP